MTTSNSSALLKWKIEQSGEGVLGFITNHSYLDNPTFRGMRQSLMNTFEQIYLLDLHGNSLKKERCPDDSKDENVFDIRQGVAIGLFIKKAGLGRKIRHADVWGLRERKTTGWRATTSQLRSGQISTLKRLLTFSSREMKPCLGGTGSIQALQKSFQQTAWESKRTETILLST